MNLPKLNVHRIGYLAAGASAAVLTVAGLVSLASQPGGNGRVRELLERYSASNRAADASQSGASSQRAERPRDRDPAGQRAQRIAARSIFSPPPKNEKPPAPVGIMGDQALFPENQWVKVGQEIKGFKLLAIGPDWAEVEVGGKPQRLLVFSAERGAGGEGQPSGATQPALAGRRPQEDRGDGGDFGGRMRSPERFLERLREMPPDVRERMLQRMPPEMRARFEGSE